MSTSPLRLPDAVSLEAVLSELDPASADADIKATWTRLKDTNLQITEWRGSSAFVFAPTGPAAADYIQIALGREIEWHAGPVVNPDYRPWGEEELLNPGWPPDKPLPDKDHLVGPIYRLLDRAGGAFVHVRSFLDRCGRIEREKREAKRPEMERRVVRETGPRGTTRETPFLGLVPDYFEFEVGFIPRPLNTPRERLLMAPETSVHQLMDRIEEIDGEVGLPFGWFFLMTHGHWVEPDVGLSIAEGLKAQRVRLPDPDAAVLLRWAERTYGF